MKPRIAVTLGDPAGVGPEITVKTLCLPRVRRLASFVVVGPADVFARAVRTYARGKISMNGVALLADGAGPIPESKGLALLDPCAPPLSRFTSGRVSAACGRAALQAVERACALAMRGRVDAMVTAPINKLAIGRAGCRFEGHTDFLQHLTGAPSCSMMLTCPQLRVVLVTVHIALREVPGKLTTAGVVRAIRHAHKAGLSMNIKKPRIGVLALNPHAGEGGRFGDEEGKIIVPALRACRRSRIDCQGPLPPDTAFYAAYRGHYDFVVAMYHDQGLIPLKMVGFESGVNVTLGLPIVRTSPDHGTAFDIAWQGRADPSSMVRAVETAVEMCRA